MSVENIKKFYTILQKDKILQCKLKNLKLSKIVALDSSKTVKLEPMIEKIIPIAKEYGCDFNVKDFKEFRENLILKHITGGFNGVCVFAGLGLLKSNHCYKMRASLATGIMGCLIFGLGLGLAFAPGNDDNQEASFRGCLGLGGGGIIVDPIFDILGVC